MYLKANRNQLSAIQTKHNKTLVLAGPGSGKTFVLCERIKHLINIGVDPLSIICITFTNAAANEITKRVGQKLGYIGTIHGFCLHFIRLYGDQNITNIFPEEEKKYVIEQLIKTCCLTTKTTASKVLKAAGKPLRRPLSTEQLIWQQYFKSLREAGSIDFDQMLAVGLNLFAKREIKAIMQRDFKHLLVDEVQDCNDIDFEIFGSVDLENNFRVGDGDQSVYGWRGANVNHIIEMANSPEWETITLEENYRSTTPICETAQELINHNTNRVRKRTVSTYMGKDEVEPIYSFSNDMDDEFQTIISGILAYQERNIALEEMAVLVRTNWLVSHYSGLLESCDIPTRLKSSVSSIEGFSDAKLIIDWMANPLNDLTTQLMIKRLYGEEKSHQYTRLAGSKMCSIKSVAFPSSPDTFTLSDIPDKLDQYNIRGKAKYLIETELEKFQEISGITEFSLYLRTLDDRSDDKAGVNVMTMHGSKGLEFEVVFLPSLDNGTIPSAKSSLEKVEEERRLLYVAITRAKRYLNLSCSKYVDRQWMDNALTEPSIFLEEIGLDF